MSNNMCQKGIEIMKEAVAADNAKNYEEAIRKYMSGIEYFMTGIKYEKNERSKEMIRTKVIEYMDRVEYLKKTMADPPAPKKAAKAQGGGDDDEKEKLAGALEGAIVREKPNVRWDEVVGLASAKAALKEAVIYPLKFPHLFVGKRKPWMGILMYGPPGTGKSYLAKAVATEVDSTFFSISSSDLVSKWMGESEKLVKSLFSMAREEKPSIVFIDEIDALASARSDNESESSRRIKTEFLVQMQGVGNDTTGVLVLGATNIPWGIDSAIRRRFEKRIYIPLPDEPARRQMFKVHLGKTEHTLKEADFEELGRNTDGYSGSDISVVVRDAIMEPIRRLQTASHFKMKDGKYIPCSPGDSEGQPMDLMTLDPETVGAPDITKEDFFKALMNVRPSVSDEDLVNHQKFTEDFGSEGA